LARDEPFLELLFARYLSLGASVLDVGCGPAEYRQLIKGFYIGVDITDEAYGAGRPRRLNVAAAAELLPFPAETFDFVMSKSAFYLMPHHQAVLVEFRRVLKTGGRILLVDYNRRTQRRFAEASHLPCWTQWQLRDMVRGCGFGACEILPTDRRSVGGVIGLCLPILRELFGTWAIVTGTK
jgi:ubiquinone/menaquinone biosynthesis C-methylase UbiE